MPLKKVGQLEIESEADSPSTIFWTVQKITMVILCILILGAVLGLTGDGILAQTKQVNATHELTVQYDYFVRKEATQVLRLQINSEKNESYAQVKFSSAYLADMNIKQIVPAPVQMQSDGEFIVFAFALAGKNNAITFTLEPQKVGRVKTDISIASSPAVTINQFVLP